MAVTPPANVRKYWHICDTLHFSEDIIFTYSRIVVPFELQTEMFTLIHESHFGIEKCKARARELLYWPRMSHNIESFVSACNGCFKFQNKHQREPSILLKIPNARFYEVGVDIMSFKMSAIGCC